MNQESVLKKECCACGENEGKLEYCSKCFVYFCEFCFGFTSSHEPNCSIIFDVMHPDLDAEMKFYKENCLINTVERSLM